MCSLSTLLPHKSLSYNSHFYVIAYSAQRYLIYIPHHLLSTFIKFILILKMVVYMLLTRQSAYIASFSQCLSSTVDIINLLHPINTLDDVLLGYHNYIDPSDNPFFHLPHSSFSDYFQSISQLQAQHPTMNIDTIMSTHRHDSKLQFIISFIIPSVTSRS